MADPEESKELNQTELASIQGAITSGGRECPFVSDQKKNEGRIVRNDPIINLERQRKASKQPRI